MSRLPPSDMLSRRCLLGGLLGLSAVPVLLLAGCGASEPSYYTLSTWPGTPRPGGPLTVEVRTPSVAAYLDKDYIVRNDNDYKLRLADNAAWASGLADMIGRTLTLDLGQRLPGSNVYTQSGAISTEALAIVEIDISRFLEDENGQAQIEATLAVYRPGSGPAGSRTLKFSRAPDNSGMAALVASLSALLGQVADVAADALRSLPPTAGPEAVTPNPA